MDEYRVKGIVISSIDYKEKDKLITLFTLEFGKISAVLRGVKNKNAKLKFASQVFCFADFILVRRGEYFTVTSAEQIESFYEITANYEAYLAGQAILEAIHLVLQPNMMMEALFLDVLRCLKELTMQQTQSAVVLTKFLLQVFTYSGYGFSFLECNECKTKLKQELYFNFDLGSVTCKQCAGTNHYEFKPRTFNSLKLIDNADFSQLHSIKVNKADAMEMVQVLHKNFEWQFNKKLKTMAAYLQEI